MEVCQVTAMIKVEVRVIDEKGHAYFGVASLSKETKSTRKRALAPRPKKDGQTPSQLILGLYNSKFFKTRRTLAEVMKKLSSTGFNPNLTSVSHALSDAEFLKKDDNTRPHKFIQKRPP